MEVVMKKYIAAVIGGVLCLSLAHLTLADTEDSGLADVNVTVDPNITMDPAGSDIGLNVQTGQVEGTTSFQVDANTQYVNFVVTCTNLYKAGDPGSEVTPILVYNEAGSYVDPDSGLGRMIPFAADTNLDGFGARQTGVEMFESSQNGHFSQQVFVTCTWDQPDPEKPEGDYRGMVQLLGMVVPGT